MPLPLPPPLSHPFSSYPIHPHSNTALVFALCPPPPLPPMPDDAIAADSVRLRACVSLCPKPSTLASSPHRTLNPYVFLFLNPYGFLLLTFHHPPPTPAKLTPHHPQHLRPPTPPRPRPPAPAAAGIPPLHTSSQPNCHCFTSALFSMPLLRLRSARATIAHMNAQYLTRSAAASAGRGYAAAVRRLTARNTDFRYSFAFNIIGAAIGLPRREMTPLFRILHFFSSSLAMGAAASAGSPSFFLSSFTRLLYSSLIFAISGST